MGTLRPLPPPHPRLNGISSPGPNREDAQRSQQSLTVSAFFQDLVGNEYKLELTGILSAPGVEKLCSFVKFPKQGWGPKESCLNPRLLSAHPDKGHLG